MAGITHSTPADGTFSASGSTAWDASHDIAAGTITEAMQVLADNTTNNASTSAHGYLLKLSNVSTEFMNGQGAWATPAGGATLNGITAATGAVTIASGNNTGIVWNWANTTNSTVAFTLGETTAATNGTSTSGIPNQVLSKFATLATSTQSPMQVYAQGVHAFSVFPVVASRPQILANSGTLASPVYSFAAETGLGWYRRSAGEMALDVAGSYTMSFTAAGLFAPVGTAAAPSITDRSNADSGLFFGGSLLGISVGAIQNSRFEPGLLQHNKGTADAVSYALNFRKSRGTVASPTVITTGDDLATISGFGYVGATGTYVEACRITFDSTGTIANTTSGTGGIMRLACAAVGAVAPAEIMRLTRATTTGGGWATLNEADASPGTGDLADGDEVAIYMKAGNIVFAVNVGGAMKYAYLPIDGTTILWVADGTGP